MPEFLSIKDAARRLGVKPKEIRRRIKDGELDGFVRLAGAGSGGGAEESGGFGPAAPNRRAAPPPEETAHVRRLEETVLVLQSELNARRQEVEELHVLLKEIKEGLAAQTQAQAPVVAAAPSDADASAEVAPTPEAAAASPAEPEIDWNAYDAESEQLRATMGRLERLLEQLDAEPEPEPEPEETSEREPYPVQDPKPEEMAEREPAVESPVQTAQAAKEPPTTVATSAATPTPVTGKPGARPRAGKSATTGSPPADDAPSADSLSRRREKMGVSREALAAFARISWGFVTEVESGRRRDAASRKRVAAALDAWQKRLNEERQRAAG